MSRKRGLPTGGRRTSSGRITITVRVVVDGKITRLSHSKVLPSEPVTYATEKEAHEGYDRVMAHIASRAANGETLADFWKKWTDGEHWWNVGRTESTVIAYESRTRAFVQRYGNRPLLSFTADQLDDYMTAGGLLSHVGAISRMFQDATKRRLIPFNPMAPAAAEASHTIRKITKAKQIENPPPSVEQIETMLARLKAPGFPASLYGWFLVGAETGMRGGEIDGMEWSQLDGNVYWVKRQWNAKTGKLGPCKHGSERKLKLNPRVMAEIEKMRGNFSKYIWTDSDREHWTHGTRAYWWEWTGDGGPSPRELCGGVTMYNSTRHHWASRALNIMGLSPYQASLLYGHNDGGRLIVDTYANGDHERAMNAALDAALPPPTLTPPTDLTERRQRRDGAA